MGIKERRIKMGLSQSELADMLRIRQSTVAMWENGTNNPNSKNLLLLSRILKCTVDELLKKGQ